MPNVPLALEIQAAIETHIAPFSAESLYLGGDPAGTEGRNRVLLQHWVSYEGSSYPTKNTAPQHIGQLYYQLRELIFRHYVEVEDLRRDYRPALALHEALMSSLMGFVPQVVGVKEPMRLISDGVVSSGGKYRYRAEYRITASVEAAPYQHGDPVPWQYNPETDDYSIVVRMGMYRSPVGQVGNAETSTKDLDKLIVVEGLQPYG